MLTNTHEENYVHSQDRYLQEITQEQAGTARDHPSRDRRRSGIAEGDAVFIESKRGRIRQKATLDTGIDPRVVSVGYGWWFPERGESQMYGWDEANLNILTDDSPPYSPEMGPPR